MTTVPDTQPRSAADLDPEFLTGALRAGGLLTDAERVLDVAAEPFAVGNSVLGELFLLRLRYADDVGAPTTMVCKLPIGAPENRALAEHLGFYVREGRFYADLAGHLAVRTPQPYWSAIDPDARTSAMLLEDLSGWTAPCQTAGATLDQAGRAMDAAAALHAAAWDRPLGADAWLERVDEGAFAEIGAAYRVAWPGFVENLGHTLPAEALDLGRRLTEVFVEVMHAATVEAPLTVCHGDFRLANLLFSPDPAEPCPGRLALLDWQMVHRGPGVEDVALLLSQSLPADLRRRSEVDLVRRWHDGLCARLGPAAVGYPLEEAWRHYRRLVLTRTLFPVVLGGSLDLSNERIRAMGEAITERAFTAALDLDAGEFLP